MKYWLSILIIAIFSTLLIYPSAFIYPKDTLPDTNDTRLIAYIIAQVQENILTNKPLFYGRYFAPDTNTLAYSEPFLISSFLTLPGRLFTNSPILIFNLAFILNLTLTTVTGAVLFYHLSKNKWATILSLLVFIFSGYHLHYYAHLQIFSFWLPFLSIFLFIKFQETDKLTFLNLFLLTSTAQLTESIFSFYLIFFVVFFLIWKHRNQIKKILFASLFVLPAWLTILYPYVQLRINYPEATRPINDAAHFSLGVEQLFSFYHGWTVITLIIFALIISKLFKQSTTDKTWFYLASFSVIMSLGPVLKILGKTVKIFDLPIPLPYTLFYYLFPGFQSFRTPSRFIILALLACSILIGLYLKPFLESIKTNSKIIFLLTILSLLLLEANLPLKGYPVNINTHPVYDEVSTLPADSIILEMPILLWNMPNHEIESIRSLYSLEHKHRRLGGFSGFATNDWIRLVEEINTYGLNKSIIEKIKQRGVTHVVENGKLTQITDYSF